MNYFYDISNEGSDLNNPFKLQYLGEKMPTITVGILYGNYRTRNSKAISFDRDTEPKDYDLQFVDRICKTNPPYNVECLLDHHYNYYLEHNPNGHKIFLKHIKYIILPIFKSNNNRFSLY